MEFKHKNILGLRFLSKKELLLIIDQAKSLKELFSRQNKQVATLRGKTLLNLFCEPSTRTKSSFDIAIKFMGASSISINAKTSSFTKGESLYDTAKNIQAMGIDGVIIRHSNGGAPHFIAKHLNVPVINAGDGYNEHPSQGLLDMFTMLEKCDSLENKNILILGDIYHSRVARSNIWGLTKLGANVFVSGPNTLIPAEIERMGVKIISNLDKEIPKMDFINVLRVQYERQKIGFFPSTREYRTIYGLTKQRLKNAKKDLVILHPGPINRGTEIDTDVADGPYNVILDQVTNGVVVRMALLYLLLTGSKT